MMNEDSNEMELFQYDSRARRRILNSESTSNSSLRQTLTANDEMTCHFNLIYFCGAVQALGLDFLPVYWQPRSGLIGSGGTSKIHQSLLALDLSLAFKAIALGDVARNRTTQDLKSMYLFLLAEIQHMGRKPILDSPYIHRVEGICWNLNVRTGAADPVLVYKKVKHGDMHRFMTSGQGSSLDFRERIEMCRDVAMGLMTLHACNIIHGDIKPQNLLVDLEDGSVVPQIADFGYSTAYMNSDPNVVVARTIPWHAPEVGKQTHGYIPMDAIRTDIFSFGMLSLWVLFRAEVATQFGITLDFADDYNSPESDPDFSFEVITSLKDQDRLRPFCQNIIQTLNLESSQEENLAELFKLSLSPHPTDRTCSFQVLWNCLNSCLTTHSSNQAALEISPMPPNAVEGQHFEFEISKSILQLIKHDIRVRQCIAECLLDQAQHATCFRCRSNAAFQASLCLAIGFGIAARKDLALEWLQKSGRSHAAFDQELGRMSQRPSAFEPVGYRNVFMQELDNNGYLQTLDYDDAYTSDHSLNTIKQSYQREVTDFAAKLGSESAVSISLSLVYALILRNGGQYADASKIQERCLHFLQTDSGYKTVDLARQDLMMTLAETYILQGMFEVASRYCEEVKIQRIEMFGHNHHLTLQCLYLEASLLKEMDHYQEAEKMCKALITEFQSALGNNHRAVLKVMSILRLIYMHQMRYDEATSLLDEEIKINEQLFGQDHYSTILYLNDQAGLYCEIGDLSKGQKLVDLARSRVQFLFGDNHRWTNAILTNCGTFYRRLGNYKESMSCYNQALLRQESLLGPDHPSTAEVVMAKAMLLVELEGDVEEIKELFRRSIHAQEKCFGENHPEVLSSLAEYSDFLFKRGKFKEAETSYRSLLLRQQSRLGSQHIGLLPTLTNLGHLLSQLTHLPPHLEVEEMYRRAVRVAKDFDGGDEETSWSCMQNLAVCLSETDTHKDEAEMIYRQIIDSKRASSDTQPMDVYEDFENLIGLMLDQGKFEAAEKSQRELIEIVEAAPDDDNADRLKELTTLAEILSQGRKCSEAEHLYMECITISANATGEHSERTLILSAQLALNMQRQDRKQDARARVFEALRRAKEQHGTFHSVTIRIGAVAAYICFEQGDQATAIHLSGEVVSGCHRLYGPENEETMNAERSHARYMRTDSNESGIRKAVENFE